MVNGPDKFLFRPVYFQGQQGDAVFKLGNRKGVEILLCQQFDAVAFTATGKKVVRVHRMNVDP